MATRVPTYSPHLRVTAAGAFGPAGSAWEIFSYGFSVAGGLGLAIGASVLSDIADDVVAFHSRATSTISSGARLTSIKIALVQPNGKWQGAAALYERTLDVAGGIPLAAGANLNHPPQVALAVTLRSAVETPRTRGRMFLPLPAMTANYADGLIAENIASDVASSVAQLVTDVNNQPGFDQDANGVVVASTFGPLSKVTKVSCGRVLDTIRTRRNAIREAYVTVNI